VGTIYALVAWHRTEFTELDPFQMMRVVIPSALSLALGLQVALASLFLSLLKVQFLETGTHRRTLRTERVPDVRRANRVA
jgi:hypothetical protein